MCRERSVGIGESIFLVILGLILNVTFGLLVLVASGRCAPVSFAWDAVVDTGLAGYRIYMSTTPGVYDHQTGKVADVTATATTATVTITPDDGRVLYFVATAYDASGNESDHSNEISWTVPDNQAPNVPGNFKLTVEMGLDSEGILRIGSMKIEQMEGNK